ncbi:hypothetical protein [Deinococcus petrolearius]|uniref:Uncharacterized protein n=1 Tax=Deinococcus petrolearius TaxID=1751295 RepID=A0ABW1DP74_9DEIO
MSIKTLTLLGLLTLIPAFAQTAPAPSAATASELLQRVINPDWPGTDSRTEVLVGQVPVRFGVPLPTGSRVIGAISTTFQRGEAPSNTAVHFDTALTPAQVTAHFTRALGAGWQEAPGFLNGPYEQQGGFQPGSSVSNLALYRKTPAELLHVTTRVVGNVTQVSLRKQSGGDTERMLEYIGARPPAPPAFLMLPKLAAPANSVVQPQGGGNSNDGVTQNARIETKLDRKALVEHYAAQLRQAGWKLVNQADAGQATTTIWSFTQNGTDRVGLLIVTGESPYRATLMTQATR